MNSKSIVFVALLAISIGGMATLLFVQSTPSDPFMNKARDTPPRPESGTLSTSPPAQADFGAASIPPPMREYDGFSTKVIIGAIQHYVSRFDFSNIYCVVEIGEDACTMTLTWELPDEYRPGSILVYNDADELIGSGWSGSVPVELTPGENTYMLSYLNEKGENYLVSTTDTFAAVASGDILGPDKCEVSSQADDICQMNVQLVGFANRVVLYDFDHDETLFELGAEGLFSTIFQLDIPTSGTQIGLFSDKVADENLLARKSIVVQQAK